MTFSSNSLNSSALIYLTFSARFYGTSIEKSRLLLEKGLHELYRIELSEIVDGLANAYETDR